MKTIYSFLALLTMVAVVSCSEKKNTVTKAPVRVKVEHPLAAQRSSATYVGVVEEHEATAVSFTSMGVVKRVLVSEGQHVSRGQLLAEIDDTQARNLLQGAEAAMTQANDAYERYSQLHDAGSLPEVQWVEIQSKVAQARSQLAVAKKNLSDCRLTAPVSGIIGRKMVSAGETALPSQAVVTILDISSVKVKVSVPEGEISAISEHTPSTITVEAASISLPGGKIEKGVVADVMTHTYDLRINVPNPSRRLLPGMVASVSLAMEPGQMAGQLLLPVTAVQSRSDGHLFVWIVSDDGKAHRTAVTIGPAEGNRVVITSGLDSSQSVVTDGYQKLSEGVKVEAYE